MGTQVAEPFDTSMQAPGAVAGVPQECFVLKWSDYHTNVADSLKLMRADGDFLDTTVACSGSEQLQAHRVVLSAFSPYLKGMLRNNPHPNPVLIMPPNVRFMDLHSLLEFMYHGEVRVPADSLESLMQLAQLLKVKGLTEEKEGFDEEYPSKDNGYQTGVGHHEASVSQPAMNNAKKRKRTASTSTIASESNDDDSRFSQSQSTSYNQAQNYDAIHPGGPNGGDETSGTGIKLAGLICPQCRALIKGPAALKEHLAAVHGILATQSPTQTPTKAPQQQQTENIAVGQVRSDRTNVDNPTWNSTKAQKQETSEMISEPEAFYCDICPKEKVRPFPTEQKLITHKKRVHPEEDLDEEDLDIHENSSRYEESGRVPASPIPQHDSNMSAPTQRPNLNATSAQSHKRSGRGGSSRGRSPALGRVNNPKERSMMGRMDGMQGKKMEAERSERMEGRHGESPRHRRVSNNTGEYTDDMSNGSSMARPIGQVSPAPRSSSNNNTGVSKVQKRPSNSGRTKADPSKSLYYNL